MTWIFWQKGWIDIRRPGHVLIAGLLSGTVSAIFTIAITINLRTFPVFRDSWGLPFFMDVTGNALLGNLIEQFAVELVDKTLSLSSPCYCLSRLRDCRTGSKYAEGMRLFHEPE